ncbi:hypothetical protein [Kocuria kalidii]|uniref:hypothetical protein n=1 Tax=Kocuria kalidii TaxID=3376283 RepID=UPI003799647B
MEPPVFGDREVMLRDHAATTDLYKMLVDVRFKLLTFVPTVTTIAVGILSSDKQRNTVENGTTLLVGVGGLLVSLAIVVYEVRNSQIHDRAIHRIKHLERLLGCTPSYAGRSPRGMFAERGEGVRLFRYFTAWHDRALSIVYGTVIALWMWTVLTGTEDFVGWFNTSDARYGLIVKAVVASVTGLAVGIEVVRQRGMGREAAIIYTLVDLIPEVHGTGAAGPKKHGGAKIWIGLKIIGNQKVPREERAGFLFRERVGKTPSVKDFVRTVQCDAARSQASTDSSRLVELAISSGMIIVRQRLWPPWNPRDDRARAVRVITIGPPPSAERLSEAIAGGQEVLECLRARNLSRRASTDPPRRVIDLARDKLVQRYGSDAPWCSYEEIRLRCELFSMALRHGER